MPARVGASKVDKAIAAALFEPQIHSNPDLLVEAFKRALHKHGCLVIDEAEVATPGVCFRYSDEQRSRE